MVLIFVYFLQTYYIHFFHILFFFYLFTLQINFCIYLLLALLFFRYHFHNNLVLYLVSLLCFFDNTFSQKQLQNTLFINRIRIIHYVNCIVFAHIPKVSSVSTSFNINNGSIIKTNSFCIKS